MQLYNACSPMVRDLLRRVSNDVAGVPPALSEQRLDASGVDGESVWFAQSKQPADDCVALVEAPVGARISEREALGQAQVLQQRGGAEQAHVLLELRSPARRRSVAGLASVARRVRAGAAHRAPSMCC